MKLLFWTSGSDLNITISGTGEPASTVPIPKRKAGILHSILTRALAAGEYQAELEVDGDGRVTFHEDQKKEIV